MSKICIYCGVNEGNEKDHIPPKSFFTEPRPSNLITVPSCSMCNRAFGKTDEIVRNLLTSLETTEIHPSVISQLGEKRNRSISRNGGIHSLNYLLDNMILVDRYTDFGMYVGKYPAFNLVSGEIRKFMERMSRALLFHINGIGYGKYKIEMKISPKKVYLEELPDNIKKFLLSGISESIGEGIFSYFGYTWPGKINSLWLLNFYRGIEFMVIVKQ